MWVRGLKRFTIFFFISDTMSHPMWVRGLKLFVIRQKEPKNEVAPHVGAWIETDKPNLFQYRH